MSIISFHFQAWTWSGVCVYLIPAELFHFPLCFLVSCPLPKPGYVQHHGRSSSKEELSIFGHHNFPCEWVSFCNLDYINSHKVTLLPTFDALCGWGKNGKKSWNAHNHACLNLNVEVILDLGRWKEERVIVDFIYYNLPDLASFHLRDKHLHLLLFSSNFKAKENT